MPRITLGLIVVALVFYLIGAKFPMMAQRIGFA